MLKYLFILAFAIWPILSFSQNDWGNMSLIDPVISPSFPGGETGLIDYFESNQKLIQEAGTAKGTVFVKFLVDSDGKIQDVSVFKSDCKPCDNTALKLVENMPDWIPATQDGKPVPMEMSLPIRFGVLK